MPERARPPGNRRRKARPATRSVAPRRWDGAAIGVDLGGTKIALGVVDRRGGVLESETIPTRAERPAAAVVDDIVRCVQERWADRLGAAAPLGLGVAGQVAANGTVLFAPNLRWQDVPLRARLARRLGRPVAVLNDVWAATYGEWKHGAGRGVDDLVCIFVGTGIGGGVVADGRFRHGASGTAGEFGHTTVATPGRKCQCPNSGCLEAYAGGWGIAARARELAEAEPTRGARLLGLAGSLDAVTAKTVEEAYRLGDPLARRIVAETADYLTAGLVSVVNAIDPALIVLGGGVIAGFPSLVPELGRTVRARALTAAARRLRIVPAALGPWSGLVGAATFARDTAG